jgi:O-antigen/teichoic acid export membrane protein
MIRVKMSQCREVQVKASGDRLSVKADQDVLIAAKGGGIVFVGRLFQYGSRFIIAFLTARFLGAEQLGLCNLALSAVFIVSNLVTLGLPAAMVRYVALFVSRQDKDRLWGTLQVGLGLTAALGVLMGLGLFALAGPIAECLWHEPRLLLLLRVVGLAVPFLALGDIVVSATQGFKDMRYGVIGADILRPIVRLALLLVLAIAGMNATKALVAFTASAVFTLFLLLYFLNNLFPLKQPLNFRMAQHGAGEMLRFSLPLYLSSLIFTFGDNLQTVLLGTFNTTLNVGIFSTASQINMVGQMFHGAIATASSPLVSELYDQGELEQMGRFYQAVTKWTFMANLPLFLIVLLFPTSILSIFGQSFVGGATALGILAWVNLVKTGTGINNVILGMTGKTSLNLVNSVVTFALTLGLNILLIPKWGLIGAAVAALVCAAIINLLRLLEVFFLFRLLPYNAGFAKPIVAAFAALLVSWSVCSFFFTEISLVHTVMNIAILLVVYVGMIFLLGLSYEDRIVLARVIQRLKSVFSR